MHPLDSSGNTRTLACNIQTLPLGIVGALLTENTKEEHGHELDER